MTEIEERFLASRKRVRDSQTEPDGDEAKAALEEYESLRLAMGLAVAPAPPAVVRKRRAVKPVPAEPTPEATPEPPLGEEWP